MEKQTIIFRADGNSEIGLGHVMRSLALAEMLKNDFECVFASRFVSETLGFLINKNCKRLIELSSDEGHFDEFINILEGNEIVVLDNYFFTSDYQKRVKARGCKLACIDDMHDKHYFSDIVINHAPIPLDEFSISAYSKACLGFQYALLRSEFLSAKDKFSTIGNGFTHAFVCFGGSDFYDLTNKVIVDLSAENVVEEITIVIGSAYKFEKQLENKIAELKNSVNIHLYKNIDSQKLIHVLDTVDFAVVPCSTILYEVISQGVPVITGYYVDNQLEISRYLKNGYQKVVVKGDLRTYKFTSNDLLILRESLTNYSSSAEITDTVTSNYIKEFRKIATEYQMEIREAETKDVDLYYAWANDSEVRKMAINSSEIDYSSHIKWFNSKLNSDQSFLYIFKKGNNGIGQVRFDGDHSTLIIGYSVDQDERGKGHGGTIIKMAIEKYCMDNGNSKYTSFHAKVKIQNISSAKIFQGLSFTENDIEIIGNEKYFVFSKKI